MQHCTPGHVKTFVCQERYLLPSPYDLVVFLSVDPSGDSELGRTDSDGLCVGGRKISVVEVQKMDAAQSAFVLAHEEKEEAAKTCFPT